MPAKLFGELLYELRIKKRLTLRKFSQLTELDPGNVSRWERGKMNPPQDEDTLNRIAIAVGLDEGTDEYEDFMTTAALSVGKLPKRLATDEEILQKLPIFFRTLDGKKISEEQFEALIQILREEL